MRRPLLVFTSVLLLSTMTAGQASAINVIPSVVGVNSAVTIMTPAGTCTQVQQLVVLGPISLLLPRSSIGYVSAVAFNCPAGVTLTPLDNSDLGFGWDLEFTAILGSLPLPAGALFSENVAFEINASGIRCLYAGKVGYLIAQGGDLKNLLGNVLVGSPQPMCGNSIMLGRSLQLSSHMTIM